MQPKVALGLEFLFFSLFILMDSSGLEPEVSSPLGVIGACEGSVMPLDHEPEKRKK